MVYHPKYPNDKDEINKTEQFLKQFSGATTLGPHKFKGVISYWMVYNGKEFLIFSSSRPVESALRMCFKVRMSDSIRTVETIVKPIHISFRLSDVVTAEQIEEGQKTRWSSLRRQGHSLRAFG
jgi:hypothetical protein